VSVPGQYGQVADQVRVAVDDGKVATDAGCLGDYEGVLGVRLVLTGTSQSAARAPWRIGGHSQLATRAQGDLGHTRPSWAVHSLTDRDLLYGQGPGVVATLVERHSRFVMLVGLPENHRADVVAAALAAKITELPEHLRRSLPWDQGREMAQHAAFTIASGVPVYFCDPPAPGNAAATRTPTGCCATTSRATPGSVTAPRSSSTPSPTSSTDALDKPSAG
jgi:Integrase core domain